VAGVTCSECGTVSNVSFRRVGRLADAGCPGCGARALHLPSAGQPNPNRGKQYEQCTRCAKKGLHHAHPEFPWIPRHGTADAGPFPAGSPACRSCEPVPAARGDHGRVLHSAEARLGKIDIWHWPDDDSRAVLEAAVKPGPDECSVCIAVGWPDGRFHAQAYLYENGLALLESCWRCGHTVLLAAMTVQEIAEQGPELLAVASRPDPRCSAGDHDEVVAPEGAFTYARGAYVSRWARVTAPAAEPSSAKVNNAAGSPGDYRPPGQLSPPSPWPG
jgi:hypothetical protein